MFFDPNIIHMTCMKEGNKYCSNQNTVLNRYSNIFLWL